MFPVTCAISAGQKFRNKGKKKIILLLDVSLTHPILEFPVFEVILPYAKSCREGEFIEFVSNMPTCN